MARTSTFASRLTLAALSVTTGLASLAGAGTVYCPTPGGTIGTPVVVDTWKDQKGGTWTLTCTNESDTGDFVWTYQAAGSTVKKVIGRCVYVGGQNDTGVVHGDGGNDDYWWHTCFNPEPIAPGKYEAIIDIFCKNRCEHSRRYMQYCDGTWVEVDRRDTSAEDFEAQDPTDSNGDTIPDEGKQYLTIDLYGPGDPPPLPADYETRVTIFPETFGPETVLFWDPGVGDHFMEPGDILRFESLSADGLMFVDPRFVAVDGPIGLELHPLEPMPLLPAEPILIYDTPLPIQTRWTLGDINAFNFVNFAFDNPLPLDALGFSNQLDFSDSPMYGNSSGEIVLGPVNPVCPGDANGDGVVDFDDLNLVLSNWNTPGPVGDINNSGFVDFDDLNAILSNWGRVCPPVASK